jgi:peptidyl-prolyl cis-trans isomerase A (cyclophilin A)/peptidyl-prolyl cis-trans isomerase B (cyclophilin B)
MKRISLFAAAMLFAAIACSAQAANPQVEIKTTAGTIVVELYADKAPKTVANFLQYVKDGQYNGTIFHRVIRGFMIQGGGYDKTYQEKPTRETIPNEAANGLKNDYGTLAMARKPDPNSAAAQFFINTKDNDFLNYRDSSRQGFGYAVFGKVVSGLDVLTKIEDAPTGAGGPFPSDVPQTMIQIQSTKLLPAADAPKK